MRITGGLFHSRIVKCPPGTIRPAMDRMRESMFSILGNLEGLDFLDLFAGSGVVALEALSRGARRVVLVEKDGGKRRTILENLSIASSGPYGIDSNRMHLLIRRVERYLQPGMKQFDVVHLDPPFSMKDKSQLLRRAEAAGQPCIGGTLMIHFPKEDNLPSEIGSLLRYDLRTYGRSHLAFYTREA